VFFMFPDEDSGRWPGAWHPMSSFPVRVVRPGMFTCGIGVSMTDAESKLP